MGSFSDIRFFGLAGLAAAVLIVVALVFPQGTGERSPKPFGHATELEKAAWKKAHEPKGPVGPVRPRPVF